MKVSEPDRHDLYQGLEEQLGKRRAETFMNLVTSVPWSEVATKSDLEQFATKGDLERMGRRVVMWTSSMVLATAGLAFAAGKFI